MSFFTSLLSLPLFSSSHLERTCMTIQIDRRHWLERCSIQDEHWDQSPWPAQMAQIDSDTEHEEEEDEDYESEHRWLHRQSRAKRQEDFFQSNKSQTILRPLYIRSNSHRQYSSSKSISSSSKEAALSRRHRSRTESLPEPAAHKLHIDTILPLQLPPPNLCTLSPLSTYPTAWWSKSQESLRRTDSTNSFLSASSDGSWHGDLGDEDPNGQLEKALNQMSIPNSSIDMSKKKTDDGLILSTYDYEDDEDFILDSNQNHPETDIDDTEQEAIRLHAGPLMNNVASFFLDIKSYYFNDASDSGPSSLHKRVLTRSHSDRALFGNVSSPHELIMESNMIHHHRRQRIETVTSRSALHHDRESSSNSLQLLWHWFMPTVDDQLERELLGCPRHDEPRQRIDSLPSLYRDSGETEQEESEDEDEDDDSPFTPGPLHDHRQINLEQGSLYDYTSKGRPNSVSKTYLKRANLSVLDTSGSPSPLWDNRWVEEPYQRTWSSVLNLPSL